MRQYVCILHKIHIFGCETRRLIVNIMVLRFWKFAINFFENVILICYHCFYAFERFNSYYCIWFCTALWWWYMNISLNLAISMFNVYANLISVVHRISVLFFPVLLFLLSKLAASIHTDRWSVLVITIRIWYSLTFLIRHIKAEMKRIWMCDCSGTNMMWIKRDQLDVICFIISLFNAQHVSDVNTSILRSLRLICWVISWVVLLWFDVCWCYIVVWVGWCGIRMQAEALLQPAYGYHNTYRYQTTT